MGLLSNKVSKEELQPGDHIYSWRKGHIYAHHGIYENEGSVIHFVRPKINDAGSSSSSLPDTIATALFDWCSMVSPSSFPKMKFECPDCVDQSNFSGIITSCLNCFLDGCDLYPFEYSVFEIFFFSKARGGCCSLIERDPPKDVLYRAKYLLENKNSFRGYNLFENNCEDFAIYCMTGKLAFENDKPVALSTQTATAKAVWTVLPSIISGEVAKASIHYFGDRWSSDLKNKKDVRKIPVEIFFDQFKN